MNMSFRKMTLVLIIGLVISCLFIGFTIVIASDNEEAIKKVLKEFEAAYNSKDAKAAVAVFHPDARIKSGTSKYSRQEYETRLPERIERFGPLKFEDIGIVIKDNKANVEAIILFTKSGKNMKMKYAMVLEDGKWLIMDQDF